MKRALSVLLTLIMIFSMLPVSVLNVRAEDEGAVKYIDLSLSYSDGVETIKWDDMGEGIDSIYVNVFPSSGDRTHVVLTDVNSYEYVPSRTGDYMVEVYGMNGNMPVYYGQDTFTIVRRDSASAVTDYHWEGTTLYWEPADRAVEYHVNKVCNHPERACVSRSNNKQTATCLDLSAQVVDDYDYFAIYTWADNQVTYDNITIVAAAERRDDVAHYDINCTSDGVVSWNISDESVKKVMVKCFENNNIYSANPRYFTNGTTSFNIKSDTTYFKPSTVFVMGFDENDNLLGYGKQVVNIETEKVKNIRFDGKRVSWDPVSWAKTYLVNMFTCEGQVITVTTSTSLTSFDLANKNLSRPVQTGYIVSVLPINGSRRGPVSYSKTVYGGHDHVGTLVYATEATCNTAGNIQYFECMCGKVFADRGCTTEISDKNSIIVPATGEHTYEDTYLSNGNDGHYRICTVCLQESEAENCSGGQAATCIKKSECEKCGAEYGDFAEHKALENLNHDEDKHWTKCEVCLQNINEEKHVEEVIPGKAATCKEEGLTDGKKCKECGEIIVEQSVIAKTAHIEEVISGKAATCKEEGLTEGKKCKTCGEVIVAQNIIPKTEHSWDEGVVTKAPTKDANGEKTYTCKVCSQTKTEVLDKVPGGDESSNDDTSNDDTSNDKPSVDDPSVEEPTVDYGVVEVSVKGKLNVAAAISKKLNGKETPEITGYIVDNKKLAKVSKKGLLTTKKVGEITVTAIHKTGKKTYDEVESIKVIIKDTKFEKKITVSNPGEQIDLSTYLKDVPKNQPVKFTTNKKGKKVADLNEETGLLVPKKAGKLSVVCTIGEGKNAVKKTCKITIKK